MGCQQLGSAGRQGVNNLKLVKDVQDVSKGFVGVWWPFAMSELYITQMNFN